MAGDERLSVQQFADELRKWWSFDNGQQHTHSWHTREDFIAKKLPELLSISAIQQAVSECSVGGEAMREAAARIAEERFIVWGRDKTGMIAAEAVSAVCENIAKAIRVLPLPPSPVKGENVTRQGGDEE